MTSVEQKSKMRQKCSPTLRCYCSLPTCDL